MSAYVGPTKTDLEPDDDVMYRLLSWWFAGCKHGVVEIVWRCPATGSWSLLRRFALDDLNAAVRFAAETNARPGASIYFRPATVMPNTVNTKDDDVVEVPGPWTDCDRPHSVARMLVATPAPSCQVITGRLPEMRSQYLYRLASPILAWESRELNRQVLALSGGDPAVTNPSTLMRLPGSIAWPWKAGRQVELTEWSGAGETYAYSSLRAALPPAEAQAQPNGSMADASSASILNPVRALLEQIAAGGAWHEPVLRLVAMLVSRGTPEAAILAMAEGLTRPGYEVQDTRRDLQQMVAGAIRKGFAPDGGDIDVDDVMTVQPTKPPTFPLFTDAGMENLPDPQWLIPGFLVANTLSPIYGPPSSYKSFLALHSALCLATGQDWFGRPVVQCDTLYIAAEGAAGMKLRVAAWKLHHNAAEIPGFRCVPCAVNLMDIAEAKRLVLTVVEEQKATGFSPKLVIVDTLHRSMPGADENSSQHMGIAIKNCGLVQTELGCAVMPVHHTGKDTDRGMRGSNSMLGASDSVNRVARTEDRVAVICEKMKDSEDGQTLNLKAIKVLIPVAGSIVPKDSLVLVVDEEPPPKGRAALSDGEAKAKQILADLIVAEGVPLPAGSGFPSPVAGQQLLAVREDRWETECEERGLSMAAEKRNRKMVVRRLLRGLLDKNLIAMRGGLLWISK